MRRVIVAAGVLYCAVVSAMAAPVQFKIVPAQGAISGANFVVDAHYSAAHKISVPAPFAAIIPFDQTSEPRIVHAPKPGNAFAKINFASAGEARLMETLLFVPVVIAKGPQDERMKTMTAILTEQAFPMAAKGRRSATVTHARRLTIGGQDAFEVVGAVESQTVGRQFIRIVGVMNPTAPDCVVIVTSVAARDAAGSKPADFDKTRTGQMISSFRYLSPPKGK